MSMQSTIDFGTSQMERQICPNCSGIGMSSFYSIQQIPVHSCLLVPSQEEALSFPTGDLKLAFCPGCGFVANTLFDSSRHNYSSRYEESQGFSACFNAFQDRLIRRLVEQYDIRDKDVLEIGCGKGEFLMRL